MRRFSIFIFLFLALALGTRAFADTTQSVHSSRSTSKASIRSTSKVSHPVSKSGQSAPARVNAPAQPRIHGAGHSRSTLQSAQPVPVRVGVPSGFHGAGSSRRASTVRSPVQVQRKGLTSPQAGSARSLIERIRRGGSSATKTVQPIVSTKVVPAPHAIKNSLHFIRDRHLPRTPVVDIKGRPIKAVVVKNPPVTHKAVVQNPTLIKNILAQQREELQTDHYYWHDEDGTNYCHYLDRYGHQWYGFYDGSDYYWTRYHAQRWWWRDTNTKSWDYYDNGYWWNQDRLNPQKVNVYVNGGYVPYNEEEPIVEDSSAQADVEEAEAKPQYHSEVDTPNYRVAENDRSFAIVVGVEDYARLPKADFAQRDAEAVRAHLRALGYPARNVVLLLGVDASHSSIEKHVETWLAQKTSTDSRVLFYFSGHGAPDPKSGATYLMPWDGDSKYLSDTGYPLARLFSKLNALPSRTVMVVLDTCFSGSGGRSVLAEGTRPLVTRVDIGRANIGDLVVMTATASDEITGALADQGHGLFTYYFLKGLNGGASATSDGISVQALHDYLRPKVEDAARLDNREQSPQLFVPLRGQRQMLIKDLR